MTRTIQILRGTEAQNDAFTGAIGELTMDTTNNEIRIHDGSTVGGHKIGGYRPDLFDVKWADHILNDVQWLRADTFSWQAGSVYQAAYQHLADDITGKTLQSETISGTTIQFYLADDGHKICPASQESNVLSIYNSTGVAWYYIIDTTNQRFKLPRTKFGFTGIRSGVGGFVEAGLPNITGSAEVYWESDKATVGAFYADTTRYNSERNNYNQYPNLGFDASRSNSIYGNSNTVQPKATEMYLYFYVGNFTQTALENTAGLNAELFNGKADVSTVAHVVTEFQEPTSANNYTWYRKYADGWVEQGGQITIARQNSNSQLLTNATLPITMADTNYSVSTCFLTDGGNSTGLRNHRNGRYTTYVQIGTYSTSSISNSWLMGWQVSGMAA